ncbi:hypothetical protein K440DRAFT_636535 [Wilcoxina mikolae CBS 423.85]|nr:hypothetical protein K440DRAFT_636535 [Wilcoxina mikolae CBS 423.85]
MLQWLFTSWRLGLVRLMAIAADLRYRRDLWCKSRPATRWLFPRSFDSTSSDGCHLAALKLRDTGQRRSWAYIHMRGCSRRLPKLSEAVEEEPWRIRVRIPVTLEAAEPKAAAAEPKATAAEQEAVSAEPKSTIEEPKATEPNNGEKSGTLTKFKYRFCWYNTLSIPIGSMGIIGIAGFLASFWAWGYSQAKTGFWARVVIATFATRVITISTAILRVFMAAQMLLCCYMLASMALEYNQVREQDKEMMTAFQRGNEGPLSMFLMFIKARAHSYRNIGGLIALGLMVLTGVASQLFSTMLLWDFVTMELPGNSTSRAIAYGDNSPIECTRYNHNP